ncbi:MAG: hypothetical protein RLZZ508_719 [Actinomycetota bacterium]|jgi:(p)ppGpp synthase/HD superfamily hydrolase
MTKEKDLPAIHLTDNFHKAMKFANKMHKDDARKSTTIPYICHPIGVASLVLEAGGDEEQVIAALLHDVAEDCGGEKALAKIRKKFGPRVESIVRGCSDSLTEDPEKKAPWKNRKDAHIKHLADTSSDVLIVTAADKTHNARSIVTDLQIHKEELWKRFNSDRESIIWYYEEIYKVLESREVTKTLLFPLKNAIDAMKAL